MAKRKKKSFQKVFFSRKAFLKKVYFAFFILVCLIGGFSTLFTGKVIRVYDGDTVQVLIDGIRLEKVRLYGIDAPEKGQAFGEAAKFFLDKKLFLKNVRLEYKGKDQYGRDLAIVYTEKSQSINAELVKNGLAMVYPQYCRDPICLEWKTYETIARQAKRGIWQSKKPMPPWQWRKKTKKRSK